MHGYCMMKSIKTGIIGCGVIAPSHIDSYAQLEGVEVVALCDSRADRRTALRGRYPELEVEEFGSVSEMLAHADMEAVSICTDHASHEELFLASLKAGKHVICEKPLTVSEPSLLRMVAAAREADGQVTAGILQHRFDPVYRVLKDVLEDGKIGRLLNVMGEHQCERSEAYYAVDGWRGTWKGEGGSLLINQSIHFLDILDWVTGGVESVMAHDANLAHEGVIETEDAAALALRLHNGALGTFLSTSGSHRTWDSAYHFIGTDGSIRIANGKLIEVAHRDEAAREDLEQRLRELREEAGVAGAKAYYGTSHPAQIRDFIEAIREGREPFVGIPAAAEAVSIVLSAYASSRSGQMIHPRRFVGQA